MNCSPAPPRDTIVSPRYNQIVEKWRSELALVRIALINITRRRLRTGLTVCGIAVGIAAFVTLVGFSKSFEREWLNLYQSEGTDLAVVQKTFLNTTVDERVGGRIRALAAVAEASPIVHQPDGPHARSERAGLRTARRLLRNGPAARSGGTQIPGRGRPR